ncbi:hypothetical protein H5T58_01725 [Candidatus Parcubacteria bacterium]|nr:hypothetical protein [Candidatus Parcubacteria bacterium]
MDNFYEELEKRAQKIPDEKLRQETIRKIRALKEVEKMQDVGTFMGLVIQIEEALSTIPKC